MLQIGVFSTYYIYIYIERLFIYVDRVGRGAESLQLRSRSRPLFLRALKAQVLVPFKASRLRFLVPLKSLRLRYY